ncbi:S24 family peptidase [Luteolibacter luteus]|uniref:S24 family peptidase n=1 Tax=Luteolibacter luteus TaxID=2728835 RepID=A0A858RHD8_9BACT|nr:S24 family peptidase [Luteolibacter luteus]QJE95991.1 S24 family peptidase [Luteolibacter luteus]
MANESEITAAEITNWLSENGHSREWLAAQTGTSVGTVANWLAANKPRPIPVPTLKLIERLMCDDLLGAPQYSYSDAKVIRRAMAQEGYTSLHDFTRDAVVANAKKIMGAREKIVELQTEAADPAAKRFWKTMLGGVAAGAPIAYVAEAEIEVGKEYPEGCYALKVFGASMEPKVSDGATIIVEPWDRTRTPKKGTIVVYSDASGSSLKEYGYRAATEADDPERVNSVGKVAVLRSLNPSFPDIQTMEEGRIDAVLVDIL